MGGKVNGNVKKVKDFNKLQFDDNTLQTVKEAADIVEIVGESVSLKKAGVNYKGLCPFHSEKTPSFTVSPARGSFHCFGCGEGGDAIAFVMLSQNLPFVDALKQLAQRYHIPLPEKVLSKSEQESASRKKIIFDINQKAAVLYHNFLLHDPAATAARRYLVKREIPQEIIDTYQLGYAPDSWDFLSKALRQYRTADLEAAGLLKPNSRGGYYDCFRNRILFPIFSHSGQHLGFGGRALDDQPAKYLNTPETLVFKKSRVLFGLYHNKDAVRQAKRCLVVEGNFDLLALAAKGVREVVAPLGTALTQQHVRAMKGYAQEAIMLFDGDKAGVKATLRSVPLFLSEKLPAKVVTLPAEHDPDTFITEHGKEGLDEAIMKASSLPEFVFGRLLDQHGLSLEGKGRIIEDLKPIIAAIDDRDLQRTLFVSHFSQKLGLTAEQLLGGTALTAKKNKVPPMPEMEIPREQMRACKLSKIEEQLLAFLIIYPEYIKDFIEAGLQEAVVSESGKIIVSYLEKVSQTGSQTGPEQILANIVGPERRFVSQQMIDAPSFPEHEHEAEEMGLWLKENIYKIKMKELTARMNEAQRSNNQALLLELLQEKNKLHASCKEIE